MTHSEIKSQLAASIETCRAAATQADDILFFKNKNGKWSIGENIIHLTKSAKGVNRGLSMPKAQLAMMGTPDHASRDYETIVNLYQQGLANGATAANTPFDARYTEGDTPTSVMAEFDTQHRILLDLLETFSETDLEAYQLPHPVLGNLTIREMYYFMDLHIRHHLKAILF